VLLEFMCRIRQVSWCHRRISKQQDAINHRGVVISLILRSAQALCRTAHSRGRPVWS